MRSDMVVFLGAGDGVLVTMVSRGSVGCVLLRWTFIVDTGRGCLCTFVRRLVLSRGVLGGPKRWWLRSQRVCCCPLLRCAFGVDLIFEAFCLFGLKPKLLLGYRSPLGMVAYLVGTLLLV